MAEGAERVNASAQGEPERALEHVKALHERDIASGHGDVELPDALARKYPRAHPASPSM